MRAVIPTMGLHLRRNDTVKMRLIINRWLVDIDVPSNMAAERYVFVTVGTTSFDALIETVTSKPLCDLFQALGYQKLMLQIGRGQFQPEELSSPRLKLECYRYKESIAEDIANASLVISHAGSGSVLESLQAGRPLVVVINEVLMGNHQVELAAQLAEDGYLYYATCSSLKSILQGKDLTKLKAFPCGQPELFASYLDSLFGLPVK